MTIDDKRLSSKISALLKANYTKRIGGGEFTGSGEGVVLAGSLIFVHRTVANLLFCPPPPRPWHQTSTA